MALTATIEDGVLTVSGDASAATNVNIAVEPDFADVSESSTPVVIDGDGSDVATIDARGVAGSDVNINASGATLANVYGSESGDTIFVGYGDQETRGLVDPLPGVFVDGGDGDDRIYVFDRSDSEIVAGDGDDYVAIGAVGGDDALTGGSGNDTLDGGDGHDVASYSGDRDDYRIEAGEGYYIVTDLREDAPDGSDIVVNIDQLHFADVDLDLPVLSDLEAQIDDGVLLLSGSGERSGPFGAGAAIVFDQTTSNAIVGDFSDDFFIFAAIDDDGSTITTVDARGVTEGGAYIALISDTGLKVYGSDQKDFLDLTGENFTVKAGAGSDRISVDNVDAGGAGSQVFAGSGNDRISMRGFGDDSLTGGGGNDKLSGGDGTDVAIFSGDMSDYAFKMKGDGSIVVTDLRAGGPDGVDRLWHIEQVRFADGVFDVDSLIV